MTLDKYLNLDPLSFLLTGLILSSVIVIPMSALAEPESVEKSSIKEEIFVTATRVATPLSRVSSSVTVITAEEIARRQLRTLPDILKAVPGLQVVEAGGAGHQTSIFARGTNSNHTLVLVDGIEVADPSNPSRTFETANFLAGEIERVEIIRGSQSTLFGSEAIGSVINIITKRGDGKPRLFGSVEGGAFETLNSVAGVRGSLDRFDYNLAVEHFQTHGETVTQPAFRRGMQSDDDGYQNLTVSGRAGGRLQIRCGPALPDAISIPKLNSMHFRPRTQIPEVKASNFLFESSLKPRRLRVS
jgi:vitamin B12 transporter